MPLTPSRLCLGPFYSPGNCNERGNSLGRPQDLEEGSAEYISLCGASLQTKAKDVQFGHEHFHFLESDKALLHFRSIDQWQIVWVKGFIHTP
jgi:hypothetical protein